MADGFRSYVLSIGFWNMEGFDERRDYLFCLCFVFWVECNYGILYRGVT